MWLSAVSETGTFFPDAVEKPPMSKGAVSLEKALLKPLCDGRFNWSRSEKSSVKILEDDFFVSGGFSGN